MKKRILSVCLIIILMLNAMTVLSLASDKGNSIRIVPGADLQESLNAGGSRLYRITADETQYYEFKIRNQSIEVNTGIGFADGFLNLFLGKMHVKIFDAYDDDVAALDVKCGYTGTLSVRFQKDKVYYIEVSSTVSGNYHFNVKKLTDLGANSWRDATQTESTGQIVSEIEASGDEDWFKFTTDEFRSYYKFELENLQASKMHLKFYEYVAAADELRNVEINGSNNNIYVNTNDKKSFNLPLKTNTEYYICIYSDGKGDYILNSTRSTDAAGSNRTDEDAYKVDTGIKYTTSFDGTKDTDYYVFTTPDYDAYYHINYKYLSFETRVYSYIYDTAGNKVAEYSGYGCDFSYNAKLKPNTRYFVGFYGDGVGNYEFLIDVKKDVYPNEKALATTVETDTVYSTSFDGVKDHDYVKFTTPDYDAYYHVNYKYLSFGTRAYSTIYDMDGNEIAEYSGYSCDFNYNAKLKPNTDYYVEFYGDGVGNYEFSINTKADPYPNERNTAKKVNIDTEYSSAFNGVKDHDYVKFTTLDTDAYYTVEYKYISFGARAYSTIYDAEGNEIANYSGYSCDFSYSAKLEPNTQYYVDFYGDGVGNYKFNIVSRPDVDGDTKAKATEIGSNEKYPSSLESSKDVDWFEVNLSDSANLLVSLQNESVSSGMYFEVYNSRDSKIMSQGYLSSNSTGSKHSQLDAGIYYIKVYGNSSGYYTLTVSPCGNGHTEVTDYAVEASCTSTGLTEGKHCSVCKTVIKKQQITSAKGHKLSYGVCTVCGYKDPNYVPTFTDVKAKAWYKQYVDYSVKNGIFSGTTKTTFSPNDNITRAQFVQVLANLQGVDTSNRNVKTQFTDVPAKKWFTAAVKWASDNKIVNGVGNGKFDPNANVTREQMCVMLTNYAKFRGITLKNVEAKESFADDKKISKWAKTAVYTCQMADIVNGKGAGKFDPQGTGTRAEASVIFTKFHKDYMAK